MKSVKVAVIALGLTSTTVAPAFAQYPGEPPLPDRTYDPVYEMNYDREWGMPNETVRQAQQILYDQGFYDGPIDGLVKNPAYLRALWNFEKAHGLPRTTHLDETTLTALRASTGVAAAR
jgi:peptidoglycan hydrolase-like protein with peptidoglycan-binding domain